MAVTHRPAGFSAVTPYLLVEDAERLLAFLRDAFGAHELEPHRVTMPDGRIMNAAVRIDDAILELGTASSTFPARAGAFHLYVADVDAAYARALTAGARSLYAPMVQFYGDREAGIIDPAGITWFLATHLRDIPPDELAQSVVRTSPAPTSRPSGSQNPFHNSPVATASGLSAAHFLLCNAAAAG
jgi:PhnB protein